MIYVQATSSITHQDSFQKANIWEHLQPLSETSEVVAPDYKSFIPATALRRLSPVLRMALTAAQDCQSQVTDEFDAISVGTALGCLKDTEKFLQTFITATSETLSPTAFIQSTHNTIGGQISLALGNHAYNMTHTQNSLSFEVALIDAMMCCADGKTNVLVGGADEAIDFLEDLRGTLIHSERPFTSGASFFVLGNTPKKVKVLDCAISYSAISCEDFIADFLKKNNVKESQISLVSHSGINSNIGAKQVNYQDYTGLYYSSSAFGFHLATDFLMNNDAEFALVVNAQSNGKLGVVLLGK